MIIALWGASAELCSGTEERPGSVRSWVDRDGRAIQAYLQGVRGEEVILVKEGREYPFPISRLSQADRAYVRAWMKDRPSEQADPEGKKPFPYLSDKELESAPALSVDLIEKTVIYLTNYERKKLMIKEMSEIKEISTIAQAHSKDMCIRGFFSHDNPDGDDPTDRARKAEFSGLVKSPDGKPRSGLSENIGRVGRYSSIQQSKRNEKVVGRRIGWQSEKMLARQIVKGLLDSPEHKKNMLDPTKAYLGVGIHVFREHVFVTQNFF